MKLWSAFFETILVVLFILTNTHRVYSLDFDTQNEADFYYNICGNWIPRDRNADDRFLARKLPQDKFTWGEGFRALGGYSIDKVAADNKTFLLSGFIVWAEDYYIAQVRKIGRKKFSVEISSFITKEKVTGLVLILGEDGTTLSGFGSFLPYASDPWIKINGPNYITPRISAYNKQQERAREKNKAKVLSSVEALSRVGNMPSSIIQSILNKDMNKLSSFVHSKTGFRIIPGYKISGKEYAYSKQETVELLQQARPIQSELFIKPISPSEYLNSMVFNGRKNPDNPKKVIYNEFKYFEIENVLLSFPACILVEYIYGSDALGLIFIQDEQETWKLSAILSDMRWV